MPGEGAATEFTMTASCRRRGRTHHDGNPPHGRGRSRSPVGAGVVPIGCVWTLARRR